MSRLRQLGFAFGIACVVAGTAGPAAASGGRHPLFDDQGTLTWYTNLDEAQAVARATGKLIFIEQGRSRCPNCQSFVERVLPASNVRARIADIAIGLADDADESDPRVDRLLSSGIASPTTLPLCGFVTPELKWSSGWSGYMDNASFGGHLSLAEDRWKQVQTYRHRGCASPTPPPTPAPVVRVSPPPAPRPPPPPAPPPARPVARVVPPPAPAPTPHSSLLDDGGCEGGVCKLPPKKVPTPLVTPPVAKLTPPPTPAPSATPRPVAPVTPAAPPVAKVDPPPATPSAPAPALPRPSRATTPAGPIAGGPIPPTPPSSRPATPSLASAPALKPLPTMDRARRAAADGRWGEVLRIADEAPRLPTAEKAELDGYVRSANEWVQTSLASAVASAKERQFTSARRTLTVLTAQLDGTTCPGLIDAERGSRAVERLSAVEQGSPDQFDAPEQIRKQAYSEFRGTRWAPLFRGRSTK